MRYRIGLLLLCLLLSPMVYAQDAATDSTAAADGCAPQPVDLTKVDPSSLLAPDGSRATEQTEAERQVRERIRGEGIHVVHFWAPWCSNSIDELKRGWYALVEQNPDVTFTFVTVWNDGASGRETMVRYAIAPSVLELTQPDPGPSTDPTMRRRQFLGLPLTWIPSTWIFRNHGELAFALNYAEMEMDVLQRLLDTAKQEW